MNKRSKWSYARKYFGWGVTVVAVSALVLLLFFCFYKFSALTQFLKRLVHILAPIIYGMIIAYLLAPIYNYLTKKLTRLFSEISWSQKRKDMTIKTMSMVLTFAFMILIVTGLLALLVPRLVESITSIINTFPSTVNTMTQSVQRLLSKNPYFEGKVMAMYVDAVNNIESWVQNDVIPQFRQMFSYFTDIMLNTIMFMKNLLIGIIVAIYILANKTGFANQSKKLLYALFGAKNGNFIMDNVRFANHAFGGFLGGKIIDSAIILGISWIALSLMNMPYALILAVVIGVTNIIPFFGPFIGAVPCTFLVLISSPIKALYFVIFILILQQFDGNILGPKILGERTGVSSFWVLFSIIFFGGLFGFVGMIIGVPLFAVIAHLFEQLLSNALDRQKLPKDADDYDRLEYIDISTNELIYKQPEEDVIVNHKDSEELFSEQTETPKEKAEPPKADAPKPSAQKPAAQSIKAAFHKRRRK